MAQPREILPSPPKNVHNPAVYMEGEAIVDNPDDSLSASHLSHRQYLCATGWHLNQGHQSNQPQLGDFKQFSCSPAKREEQQRVWIRG